MISLSLFVKNRVYWWVENYFLPEFCRAVSWSNGIHNTYEEMNPEELNKCLQKFYVAAKKKDDNYFKRKSLTAIRAAIDRHLRSPPLSKPFSIVADSQFKEGNKTLSNFLKILSKNGEISGTKHKGAVTREVVQKLYEKNELVRLYFLVMLKRAGVPLKDIVAFYTTAIRPVLEYCSPVFHHALPKYLCNDIERVQKRALSIIMPINSYEASLVNFNLTTLQARREQQCFKLFDSISGDH